MSLLSDLWTGIYREVSRSESLSKGGTFEETTSTSKIEILDGDDLWQQIAFKLESSRLNRYFSLNRLLKNQICSMT